MFKKLFILSLFCICCLASKSGWALETASGLESQLQQLTQTVNDLKLIVEAQQREISALKVARVQAPPAVPSVFQVPQNRSLQGRWNPDIGVVADIVFLHDSPKEDEEGADRLSVRELELIFGSAVDPYSRFDATLAISDFEEMELEEAYLTHFGLPWDLKARVGRFLPRIGKALPVHRDSLDTVDEPLVIQRYFGHHGYNKTGVDVSRIIDLPWPVTHEATIGVLEGGNGEEGSLFGESRRRPTVYSHLKNYIDLNDVTGLEVGLSHMAGSADEDTNFEVQVYGLDGTFIHQFGPEQTLKFQGEVFHVNRQDTLDLDGNTFGAYALIDLQINKQWAAGFRYDYVEIIQNPLENPEKADIGYTAYVTLYQSEFARWRVQFTHVDLTSGEDDNQVMIQGTFAIGEHKHKLQ